MVISIVLIFFGEGSAQRSFTSVRIVTNDGDKCGTDPFDRTCRTGVVGGVGGGVVGGVLVLCFFFFFFLCFFVFVFTFPFISV